MNLTRVARNAVCVCVYACLHCLFSIYVAIVSSQSIPHTQDVISSTHNTGRQPTKHLCFPT